MYAQLYDRIKGISTDDASEGHDATRVATKLKWFCNLHVELRQDQVVKYTGHSSRKGPLLTMPILFLELLELFLESVNFSSCLLQDFGISQGQ